MKNKIVEIALAEVGEKESPHNSNKTKYGDWFGLNGRAWCGIFVSWCYHFAGYPIKGLGYVKGFAGCQTAERLTKNKRTNNPEPGDICFFDFNKDKVVEHTGIFVRKIDDVFFECVEGNTAVGNNSNGGQVMLRERKFSDAVFVNLLS